MSGVKPERAATAAAGRGRAWAPWVVGTALAAAVLMFCYLRIAGATQVNSDGAGLVSQASDMLHGNLLLHGWWATDVAFYTTELPEYLVVTAAAGVRPEVVHICSAITYTLLVLLAAFVARGRARGAEGMVRAVLAAGIILAPQPTGPTLVLLGNPDHVGTGVPVLVLLLLLDWAAGRAGRARWWVPVVAGLLLAWSIIGDPLIEVVGVVPLFLASVLRAGWILWSRRVAKEETGPAGPRAAARRAWSAAWYEWSLALAAVAAVFVAAAGNRLIGALGGYAVARPAYGLQSLHEMVHGLRTAAQSVLVLFGADYKTVTGAGNVAFALVHLIGVAVALAGFGFGVWCLLRPFARLARASRLGAAAVAPGDLVTDFLVIAIAANCAAFVLEVPIENIYSSHEIAPVLSLGAALAGRTLGSVVYGRRPWTEPALAALSPDCVGRHCAGRRPGPGPPAGADGSAAHAAPRPGGRAGRLRRAARHRRRAPPGAAAQRGSRRVAGPEPPDQRLRSLLGGSERQRRHRGSGHGARRDRQRLARARGAAKVGDQHPAPRQDAARALRPHLARGKGAAVGGLRDVRQAAEELQVRPLHDLRLAREPGTDDEEGGQGPRDANGQRHQARLSLAGLVGLLPGLAGRARLVPALARQDGDDRAERA